MEVWLFVICLLLSATSRGNLYDSTAFLFRTEVLGMRNVRYKDQVAYERLVLHAFELPHVVSTFRTLSDDKAKKSDFPAEGPTVRRGRLKTVAGTTYTHTVACLGGRALVPVYPGCPGKKGRQTDFVVET